MELSQMLRAACVLLVLLTDITGKREPAMDEVAMRSMLPGMKCGACLFVAKHLAHEVIRQESQRAASDG